MEHHAEEFEPLLERLYPDYKICREKAKEYFKKVAEKENEEEKQFPLAS